MPPYIVNDSHAVEAPKDAALRPIGSRVLVKLEAPLDRYRGILYIPQEARDEPQKGDVVAVGPGDYETYNEVRHNGSSVKRIIGTERIKPSLDPGDKILIAKYAGHDVKVGQESHCMCRETDVLGTIQEGVFVPLHNQVAIKMDQPEQRVGALWVPDNAKRRVDRGTVVAVGVGWKKNGRIIDMDVRVGDRVLFAAYAGEEHEVESLGLVKMVPVEHCLALLESE